MGGLGAHLADYSYFDVFNDYEGSLGWVSSCYYRKFRQNRHSLTQPKDPSKPKIEMNAQISICAAP